MRYIEICGSPGSGKSTLIDYKYPPDAIKYDNSAAPLEWKQFLDYCQECIKLMEHHKTFSVGKSLVNRSIKKMITVNNKKSDKIYLQTGFFQRSLGIYYRVDSSIRKNVIVRYLELCPTPLGIITLNLDRDTIKERNRTRNKQNRHFMIDLTEDCMILVRDVIAERCIKHLDLDSSLPISTARELIEDFVKSVRTR